MNVNLSTAILREKDAAFHFHPFTDNGALKLDERRIIVRADGVWLWDSEGNRILDGMAGLWCVNVGHGRPEIIDAVRSQMSEISYQYPEGPRIPRPACFCSKGGLKSSREQK